MSIRGRSLLLRQADLLDGRQGRSTNRACLVNLNINRFLELYIQGILLDVFA